MKKFLPKKKDWFSTGEIAVEEPAKKAGRFDKVYSVAEVAEIFSIDKQTVYKWLSLDHPEDAVIDAKDWFKLPNGYIRIKERAILKIMKG